jgi:hypothetical protein
LPDHRSALGGSSPRVSATASARPTHGSAICCGLLRARHALAGARTPAYLTV